MPVSNLNLNVRRLAPSATLRINELSAELAKERPIYRLGLGQSPFPVPESVVEALQENAHRKDYLPVRGLPALRQTAAEYLRRQGRDFATDDLIIGPGSKELLFILQLAYAGELLAPSPSWVSYTPQAQLLGLPVTWLATRGQDHWRLTAATLERACAADPDRPRVLILNHPSNPTGMNHEPAELERIAEVARRFQVLVVSDEIYSELYFTERPVSIAHYYPEGTIVSTGLSKWCGAGGWRLGFMALPRPLRPLLDAMVTVASETFTSVSAPVQHAAVVAFNGGPDIDRYLHDSRRIMGALTRYAAATLTAAGADVAPPEGGFYVFPDFSALRDGLASRGVHDAPALAEHVLRELGVAGLPGTDFGRPAAELTQRYALVDFDGGAALAAAAKEPPGEPLGQVFLRQHTSATVEAVDRLADWMATLRDGRVGAAMP